MPADPRNKKVAVVGKRVTAIEYIDVAKARRENVEKPHLTWRHDFTAKDAVLIGLPNGDILIRSKSGKRLWKYC